MPLVKGIVSGKVELTPKETTKVTTNHVVSTLTTALKSPTTKSVAAKLPDGRIVLITPSGNVTDTSKVVPKTALQTGQSLLTPNQSPVQITTLRRFLNSNSLSNSQKGLNIMHINKVSPTKSSTDERNENACVNKSQKKTTCSDSTTEQDNQEKPGLKSKDEGKALVSPPKAKMPGYSVPPTRSSAITEKGLTHQRVQSNDSTPTENSTSRAHLLADTNPASALPANRTASSSGVTAEISGTQCDGIVKDRTCEIREGSKTETTNVGTKDNSREVQDVASNNYHDRAQHRETTNVVSETTNVSQDDNNTTTGVVETTDGGKSVKATPPCTKESLNREKVKQKKRKSEEKSMKVNKAKHTKRPKRNLKGSYVRLTKMRLGKKTAIQLKTCLIPAVRHTFQLRPKPTSTNVFHMPDHIPSALDLKAEAEAEIEDKERESAARKRRENEEDSSGENKSDMETTESGNNMVSDKSSPQKNAEMSKQQEISVDNENTEKGKSKFYLVSTSRGSYLIPMDKREKNAVDSAKKAQESLEEYLVSAESKSTQSVSLAEKARKPATKQGQKEMTSSPNIGEISHKDKENTSSEGQKDISSPKKKSQVVTPIEKPGAVAANASPSETFASKSYSPKRNIPDKATDCPEPAKVPRLSSINENKNKPKASAANDRIRELKEKLRRQQEELEVVRKKNLMKTSLSEYDDL